MEEQFLPAIECTWG